MVFLDQLRRFGRGAVEEVLWKKACGRRHGKERVWEDNN